MKISRIGVEHPSIIGIILIALALFGVVSITSMNMEFMGNISVPEVFIIIVYPGASAEEVENTIVNVVENDVVTLEDFKKVSSTSLPSVASINLTFSDDVDVYDKINDVRNRINDLKDDLPAGIEQPQVLVGGASMLPVFSFSVHAGEDIAAVTKYIEEELTPRITQVEGVSTITVSGTVEPRVNIKLNINELDAKNISPLTIYQILNYSNISLPLGYTDYAGHEISVRYDGQYNAIDELSELPVGASEDGKVIKLGDVAEISLENLDNKYTLTHQGENILLVDVCKRLNGNSVTIANEIKKILEESEKELSGAIEYSIISDDSKLVKSSLSTVLNSGFMGVAIAILVILAFLNDFKATLAIGMSIPISIFFTFIGMKLTGISINLLSVSGIVVALGSIVDASIVVLDQIYRFYQRRRPDGSYISVTESIYKGTDIVGGAVIGSNLTTVVVYIPFLMLSGIVGEMLHDVSITIMISILSSLVVALIIIPWLLKKLLKDNGPRTASKDSFIVKGVNRAERGYGSAIGYSLKHPGLVLVLAVGILIITGYTLPKLEMSFIPATDNSDFYVSMSFPYGYQIEETKKGMVKAEEILLETVPEEAIETYVVYSGMSTEALSFSNTPNMGGMHIILKPVKDRDFDIFTAIRDLQFALEETIPDATVKVSNGGFDRLVGYVSGGGGYGLSLVGNDEKLLYETAQELEKVLVNDPEVISASIDTSMNNTDAVINMSTEYLSSLGLSSYEAGMTAAILFNGVDSGKFHDGENSYDIRLYSDIQDYPMNESTLSKVSLTTQAGSKVSFPALSDIDMETTLSQINHSDRAKTVTISAQLTTESPTGVTNRMNAYLEENPLPDGITTKEGGLGELLGDSFAPIAQALAIAIFLVYFIMVIIFERFRQPLLVMMTVPFCLIGVVLALIGFGSSINMVSILGIVSLAGMLVNNGIIMVDYINQLQDEERRARVGESGVDTTFMNNDELYGYLPFDTEMEMLERNTRVCTASRLRPILMSSLTTILGVIPMAFATGEGAEVYAPLGQVIMGGLATSMLITLFIMPVFYYLSERGKLKKIYKKKNIQGKRNENEK